MVIQFTVDLAGQVAAMDAVPKTSPVRNVIQRPSELGAPTYVEN